jgi:hypothetical protein
MRQHQTTSILGMRTHTLRGDILRILLAVCGFCLMGVGEFRELLLQASYISNSSKCPAFVLRAQGDENGHGRWLWHDRA